MSSTLDLTSLSRSRAGAAVPMPGRRLGTRVLLPLAVLLCAGGVLAYAARGALLGAIPVRVVPVVQKEGEFMPTETASPHAPARRVLVQAPGWIEPDPYAVTIPALAEGVVRDLLIVEGQVVEQGEVVARMVDDDAKLAVRRAQAEVQEMEADVARSRAEVAAATARTDELRDDLMRKRPLVEKGAIGAAELTQLELRVHAAERGIAAAEGMVAQARAAESRARVMLDEAALLLSRMVITAPIGGVVMQRMVEPGMRISMGSAEGMTTAVARLYDPAKLQVRVDVPVSDAAKVAVGDLAEVMTDALPDTVFIGRVVRAVHEGNIQRNTVQFKVAIAEPSPTLKPEMLARVRLLGPEALHDGAADGASGGGPTAPVGSSTTSDGLLLLLPESALAHRMGDAAHLWLVDQSNPTRGAVARMGEVGFTRAEDGLVRITRGLRPGDRVIVDPPPNLNDGSRIRIIGEMEEE